MVSGDPAEPKKPRPALWMLAGAFAFATMGAFTHAVGDRCDWLLIGLFRAVVMFVTSVGIASATGVKLVLFKPLTLWQRSLAGSFSLVCNFYSMTRLPIGDALTLANTYPIWIVLVLAIQERQRPAWSDLIGVASGVLGVVLMQNPELDGDRVAAGIALLGALATCFAMLGLHRLKTVAPLTVVAHFSGVATVVTILWLLIRGETLSPRLFEPATLGLLLGVGLSGTLGQMFLTRAYAAAPPTRISVIGLSQVVFALGFDVLIWSRTFHAMSLLGITLVLAPAIWLSLRAGFRSTTVNPALELDGPLKAEVP